MLPRIVYKYPIPTLPNEFREIEIKMPSIAKILLIDIQRDRAWIWAEVNPDSPELLHKFLIVPTGREFNRDGLKHMASYQIKQFVWHLYRIPILETIPERSKA